MPLNDPRQPFRSPKAEALRARLDSLRGRVSTLAGDWGMRTRRVAERGGSGVAHGVANAVARVDALLPGTPDGSNLPRHGWRQRHAWIVATLWLHVPLLFVFGVWGGVDHVFTGGVFRAWAPVQVAIDLVPVMVLAGIASVSMVSRRMRSFAAGVGYATAAVLLVHFSGGLIEAHFHILLVLALLSLYQDWLPLIASVLLTAVHHVVVGLIDPTLVYNHPAALAHPVRWAFVHSVFVVGLASVEIAHWRSMRQVRDFGDLVVEASEEGLVGLDESGHVTFVNGAAARLLGDPKRLRGMNATQIFSNRLPGMVGAQGVLRTLDDGTVHRGRGVLVVTAQGDTRYVDWSSVPLGDKAGFSGVVVSLRDVTERHLAERKLRQKEAQLLAAQRIAHLGSFEWAPVSDVLQASDEFHRIVADPDNPEPRMERLVDLLARIHRDDRQRVRAALEGAHHTGQDVDVECRILGATGVRHCEIRARLEHGAETDGPTRLVRGSIHDVTERVRAENARRRELEKDRQIELLRQQDEFKNRFINAVAHELKTPLTPLRLQLHLLKMDPERRLSPRQQGSVLMLERNVRRFGALVEDLLDTARLQGGRMRLRPVPVDLAVVVDEAVRQFEPVAASRDQHLSAHGEAQVIVHGDRERLHQVLANLLSNASKFTPPGGEVEVSLRRQGDDAVVVVRDSGIGLHPDDLPRLFQPFQQLAESLHPTDAGTGLGLYLSRGLVDAMGGTISCESPGEGAGATFTVRLRAAPSQSTIGESPVVAALDRDHHGEDMPVVSVVPQSIVPARARDPLLER